MNIARLSIKRPIFMACLVILMLVLGTIGFNRLGVDLFPPIDFPVVVVYTTYPGTSPEEIEKLITKPIEEQVATIAGIKRLSSRNMEGVSIVVAEFDFDVDIRYAEEKMREKVSFARNSLPDDLEDEPVVRQFDFTDVPVITLAFVSDLPPTEMYDVVKEKIKPVFEQVDGVGEVRISGGTRREIRVELDRNKLNDHQISALTVVSRLQNSGVNVPVGRYEEGDKLTVFRTIGEFKTLDQLRNTAVQFSGDFNNPTTVGSLGVVRDGAEDAETLASFYYPVKEKDSGKEGVKNKGPVKHEQRTCLILDIFKQSGANTVSVADGIMKRIDTVNGIVSKAAGNSKLVFVYDMAKFIRRNIDDVKETMVIGIILAIVVVYLFLGNIRSTIITGIAIPNSLLGAFVLMYFMGFTVNMMTLLALSLTIGLLVDDAIVVRENIFRKIEEGHKPFEAAEIGTTEVTLAVIATSLTIIAVFLPIGFLQGIVGRFFKQFGLTVVFAMMISLFDALTVAPLLSAYFAGSRGKAKNFIVTAFDNLQNRIDRIYMKTVRFSIDHPIIILLLTSAVFFGSLVACSAVKKTFQPDPDEGEYMLNIELSPGTSLEGTNAVAQKIADKIKTIPELDFMTIQVGTGQAGYNKATLGIFMVPRGERKRTTAELKEVLRNMMKEFAYAKPSVDNYSRVGGGGGSNKPYLLNIKGEDLDVINDYSLKLIDKLKTVPDLTEIKSSMELGVPELQIRMDEGRMLMAGVNNKTAGTELRYHVEGAIAGKFRDKGIEYDIRVRLQSNQRDLRKAFEDTRVPNMQNRLVPLPAIATAKSATGPSMILRQDRARAVQISANLAKGGAIGSAIDRTKEIIAKELPLPDGVSYGFIGQADSYQDMIKNILVAFALSLIFIYLVLSSLYESFITPFTILLALPPALSGAFFSLYLTGKMMDMFSMIGIIMLLGLVTKNSILMVDFALEGVRAGKSRKDAIMHAGQVRLRPILMTTFAMLAGTLPVAIGAGEAAKYRTGMGVAIMGGLIVSTLITLVVVPAVFEYIDIFREAVERRFRPEEE